MCDHNKDKWVKGKLYMICENNRCFLTVDEYNGGVR